FVRLGRDKNFTETSFKVMGKDAVKLIKAEPRGLRINLPAALNNTEPVGVATQFPLQGDVEITVGYEIIHADRPKSGWGVGLEVYLMTDTPKREALGFYRKTSPDGTDVYESARITTNNEGNRERLYE